MNLKEIKEKIIISEIIKNYINLKKKKNQFWGKCVFHEEKTPSFLVNDEKGIYHCFGCGAHGDIFSFLINFKKKTFKEVLEEIDEKFSLNLKKKNYIYNNHNIFNLLQDAAIFYKDCLKKNLKIQSYLNNRNISEEIIEKYFLGYAEENTLINFLLKKYSLYEIKSSGIISMGLFDRLRNRIIFPIYNEKNQIIAFAGRNISEEKPKYLNFADTDIFNKNFVLYNIQNIPYNVDKIFLVEGYIDVITMSKYNFYVVASMGTSVSKNQIFMLMKRSKNIYIIFDGDTSGEIAMERFLKLILEMIKPGYNIFFGKLPSKEDPDSFFSKNLYKEETFFNLFLPLIDKLFLIIENNLKFTEENLPNIFHNMNNLLNSINDINIKTSYEIILKEKIKKKFFQNKKTLDNNSISYLNKEENIISIILFYPDFLEEFIEDISRINFNHSKLEIIRKDLVENIENEYLKTLINKYKEENYIKNIIKKNNYILMKKDFCKKYLFDILILLSISK